MKTLYRSLVLFTIPCLLFFQAKSQADIQENNYQKLQNTMTDPVQSDYNLIGFEGRAIQKTQDFADYLEIISNKHYDISLRKHTASLVLKLFNENSTQISNNDDNISSFKVLDVQDYVDNFLNTEYTKIVVEITDFNYIENLRSNKSDAYTGKLEFVQTNKYFNKDNISDEKSEHKEVEIILVKTTKEFGKKSKDVWNVFLGEIKTVK